MLTLPIKLVLTLGSMPVLLMPTSAIADPCTSGGSGINCGIGGGGGTGGGGGGTGGDGEGGGNVDDIPPIAPDPGGVGAGGGGGGGGNPPPAPVDPVALASRARASAVLPTVSVHTSPKDRTYVHLLTRLWVDGFEPVETRPISEGGMTVQAFAKPETVDWDLGETQIQCTGGGSPSNTSCSYTYKRSSARATDGLYQIKGKVTWSVTWTCIGPCTPSGGTLPPLFGESEPQALTVGEIQTGSRPG